MTLTVRFILRFSFISFSLLTCGPFRGEESATLQPFSRDIPLVFGFLNALFFLLPFYIYVEAKS